MCDVLYNDNDFCEREGHLNMPLDRVSQGLDFSNDSRMEYHALGMSSVMTTLMAGIVRGGPRTRSVVRLVV